MKNVKNFIKYIRRYLRVRLRVVKRKSEHGKDYFVAQIFTFKHNSFKKHWKDLKTKTDDVRNCYVKYSSKIEAENQIEKNFGRKK